MDSIIHVKMPKKLHTKVKVRATQEGLSMNQYVKDLLESATGKPNTLPTTMPKTLKEANDPNNPGYSARIAPDIKELEKIKNLKDSTDAVCTGHEHFRANCGRKGCLYA